MLTPSVSTLANYNSAIMNGNATHVRMVFPVQNITLSDADISANGGLTITEMLNPDTDLEIGRAVCSEFVVNLLNNGQFTGFNWSEEFRLDFGVEINGSTEWVTKGYFTGSKPNRIARQEIITFTAYDRMKKAEVEADKFLETVTFPITIANFYSAICTYLGITKATGDDIASVPSYTIDSNVFNEGLTCRDLLAYVAESVGCNIRMTADGKFKTVWYTDQTSVYTLTGDQYFSIDIDEASVPAIDCVRLSSTDQEGTNSMYPISGYNVIYQIVDNPVMLQLPGGQTLTELTNMVSRFGAFGAYIPANVNAIGNWMVEVGDIIEILYDGSNTLTLPIFNRTLQWNGGCFDTYECTGKAVRTGYSKAVKDKYDTGEKLSKKYSIKSGVDITDQGVTISGGKFLKLISGGVLDVQSTNFSISSADKRMVTGNWKFDDDGMLYYDSSIQTGFEIADIDDKSSHVSGIYYDHVVYSDHSESGIVKILVNNKYGSTYDDAYFSFYNQYNSDTNNYQKFFLPDNDGYESVIGSIGNPFKYANINQLNVSYILPRSTDYTLGFVGTSAHPFYNGYIRSIRTNKLYVLDDADNNLEVYGNISGYSSDGYIRVGNSGTEVYAYLWSGASGNHGIYSNGYWNGSQKVADGKWMLYRGTDGVIHLSGDADTVDGYHASSFTKKAGDTMTGNLNIQTAGETFVGVKNTNTGAVVFLDSAASVHGLNSNGYWNGSSYVSDAKWMVYRDTDGIIKLNGSADTVDGYHASDLVKKSGDTMTGNLGIQKAGDTYVYAKNTNTGAVVYLDSDASVHGLYSNGYWNGSAFVANSKWLVYRDTDGLVKMDGNATYATTSSKLSEKPYLDTSEKVDDFLDSNTFKVGIWSNNNNPGISNGIILSGGYTTTNYGFQIAIDDDPTYWMAIRQKNNGTWAAWKRIPIGDGTGASGTWGINITGSAGSVAWENVSGRPTKVSAFTNDAGYLTQHQDISGKVNKSGDTMSGDLTIQKVGEAIFWAKCTGTSVNVALDSAPSGNHGIWTNGYWNGSSFVSDAKWMMVRGTDGVIRLNGSATSANTADSTKSVITDGRDVILGTSGSGSDDSGDLVWRYGNSNEKMRIWTDNTYTAKKAPNFREFKSDGTSLYSGCLPLGDGTGASGTWGISVTGSSASCTGNAATATRINGNLSAVASGGHNIWVSSTDVGDGIPRLVTGVYVQADTKGIIANRFQAFNNNSMWAQLYADGEGGNLKLWSPNGQECEFDHYNDAASRIYQWDSNGNYVEAINYNSTYKRSTCSNEFFSFLQTGTLTWGTSYAAGDAGNRGYTLKRAGNTVNLTMHFKPNSATSEWTTIATLPDGYKPNFEQIWTTLSAAATPVVKCMKIKTNGEIQMLNRTTDSFQFSACFLTSI